MRRAYGLDDDRRRHVAGDAEVLTLVAALVLSVWGGVPVVLAALAATVWWGRWRATLVVLAVCVAGCWAGRHAWAEAAPRQLGSFTGWVRVAADPMPLGRGLRLTMEVEGERFDAWIYGWQRDRLGEAQVGEYLWVQAERTPMTSGARRAAVRHVVGRLSIEVAGDVVDGSGLDRASNRVRRRLRDSAEAVMAPADAALFTGLVLGDDAREPPEMLVAFRTSGLSHLTAVSGQNVAFVLAAATPLLRRLRPWWRWAGTIGTVGWFMLITRFEPSVLRAGFMAALAATAFVLGLQASVVRLLALAVGVLVLVDPLLVWSVGFWLSVGATAGVCVLAPLIETRLPGPVWLRAPMSLTLGAQAGVALPSVLVFHRLPLVSPLANLAAVPVAGLVMLYGLPSGFAAAWLPSGLRALLMMPNTVGTRWVAQVAQVGAVVEPSEGWSLIGWSASLVAWVWWWRARGRYSRGAPVGVPI